MMSATSSDTQSRTEGPESAGDATEVAPQGATAGGAPAFVGCYVCAGIDRDDLAWSRFTGRRGSRCQECKDAGRK